MKDPNPRVAGKGIAKLRRAGVAVVTGVLEEEAQFQNRFFVKHIRTHFPYVHLKIAQTLDGFIAQNKRMMRYISCVQSRTLVHKWRTEYDGVLVGAGTIRVDNPQLNVRLATGREPAVIIIDGNLSVTGRESVFSSANTRTVLVCVSDGAWKKSKRKISSLQSKGVHVLPFPSRKGVIPLKVILRTLYERQFGSLLVEGGTRLSNEFVKNNLVDEFSLFISPTSFGKGVRGLTDRNAARAAKWFLNNKFNVYSSGTDSLTTGQIIHK
jgi:diaminohydroxyphosphoribosylaminopyrimidine deaminase/5-amino-6-(5-phosphoribosylamino)uracil reductase